MNLPISSADKGLGVILSLEVIFPFKFSFINSYLAMIRVITQDHEMYYQQ